MKATVILAFNYYNLFTCILKYAYKNMSLTVTSHTDYVETIIFSNFLCILSVLFRIKMFKFKKIYFNILYL